MPGARAADRGLGLATPRRPPALRIGPTCSRLCASRRTFVRGVAIADRIIVAVMATATFLGPEAAPLPLTTRPIEKALMPIESRLRCDFGADDARAELDAGQSVDLTDTPLEPGVQERRRARDLARPGIRLRGRGDRRHPRRRRRHTHRPGGHPERPPDLLELSAGVRPPRARLPNPPHPPTAPPEVGYRSLRAPNAGAAEGRSAGERR